MRHAAVVFSLLACVLSATTTMAQTVTINDDSEAVVALPDHIELPGFTRQSADNLTKMVKEDATSTQRAFFSLKTRRRNTDLLHLNLEVAILKDPADGPRVSRELLGTVERTPELKSPTASYTGRRIGEKCWSNETGSLLVVYDGRVAVAICLTPHRGAGLDGKRRIRTLTREDPVFAENLVIRVLDRMTAMGFTSRLAEHASSGAKRQVAMRLQALRQHAAQK